jgi:Transcriptional regulator
MNLINLDIRMLRSLMSVVETGSITETARRLGRTQPAITLQLQRLEELTGKAIFIPEGRRLFLTTEGETVLSYARSIVGFHDEMLSQLASPDIEGHVVLGTPDLYAAFMLPSILRIFRKAFPRVQLELNCSLSTPLVGCVKRGEVDIALVTRMNDFTGGQVVRQEQLIWMTGEQSTAHNEKPIPLALLPPGNIYRDHAIDGWKPQDSDGALPASVRASAVCRPPLSPAWRSPSSAAPHWYATCARSVTTRGCRRCRRSIFCCINRRRRHQRPQAPCTTIWRIISISTTTSCWARSCLCPPLTATNPGQDMRGRNWLQGRAHSNAAAIRTIKPSSSHGATI